MWLEISGFPSIILIVLAVIIIFVLWLFIRLHPEAWEEAKREVGANKGLEYPCLVKGCGKKFKSRKELQQHLLTAHSERLRKLVV